MIRAGLLGVSVLSVAALWAASARTEIRIGVAGPMTGVYAWAGERYQRGAELAVENLNVKGGVLGQTVELIVTFAAGIEACEHQCPSTNTTPSLASLRASATA